MKEPGIIIKEIRKSKGLSTYELAKLTNVSHTAIANIENGKTKNISIYLVQKLSKVLETSISKLFPTLDFLFDNTNSVSENKIEELKKALEEKDKTIHLQSITIDALEKQAKYLKYYYSINWVMQKNSVLSGDNDEEYMRINYKNISDSFTSNLRKGLLTHQDIIATIGSENHFPELQKWYEYYKEKYGDVTRNI
jgi:transcriptional regulator with XRE-family HTH domain